MDRIHDKANKFLNEVCKKKLIKVSNTSRKDNRDWEKKDGRNFSDLTHNSCLFCEKVFISSNYLMKHVYRRHSEHLIKLHKRCLQHESGDVKKLFNFLEEEFLDLKNELSSVKQAVGHKVAKGDLNERLEESSKEPLEHVRHISKSCVGSETVVADIDPNEIEALKGKLQDVESNTECLRNKFKEFDSVMKTEVAFKQDIQKYKILNEEKILREQELQFVELRRTLPKELKIALSKELNENNVQWNSKFSELKHDIRRLDHIIADIKKQIDSPDLLKGVENRLEQHIVNFLGSTRCRTRKRGNSRVRNRLSKVHNTYQDSKISETDNFDSHIIKSSKHLPVCLKHNVDSNKSCILPEELSYLIAEKLSEFNIPSSISRMSAAEYEEKLKLINSYKDNLKKKYHNFSEIYNNVNMCVDHRVLSKLKGKKSRKLRFSEPLTSSSDMAHNLKSEEADFLSKACPVVEDKNNQQLTSDFHKYSSSDIKNALVTERHTFVTPESERFLHSGVDGGGDCSGNFPEYRNSFKGTKEPKSAEDCKASSPVIDSHVSLKTDFNISKVGSFSDLPVSSSAYKNIDCVNKNIDYVYSENCEPDDYDDISSLESLSLSEDDENSLLKDELQ